jgi:hypothetical protein
MSGEAGENSMWKTWLTPLSQHQKRCNFFGNLDKFVAFAAAILTKRRFGLYEQLVRDRR